jgi:hypothetical protein
MATSASMTDGLVAAPSYERPGVVSGGSGLPMQTSDMRSTSTIRDFSLHAAGALMALMALACLAVAFAVVSVVPGIAGVPLAALAAVAAFQALRVPVGRASSWLLDR